jgi:iron-sulfur cluster assembly protein
MTGTRSEGRSMATTGLSLDLLKLGAKPKAAVAKATEAAAVESRITVTASAAAAIKDELAKRPTTTEASGFRVGVKAGGCSGLSYTMQFEDHPRPEDKVIVKDGAKVYCDPKSHVYLAGTELDFVRTLMKTGFEFKNPQQKSACGCGESFTI